MLTGSVRTLGAALAVVGAFVCVGLAPESREAPVAIAAARVDDAAAELERRFAEDVLPILDGYCLDCHGERRQKGKVRFDRIATIDEIVAMGDALAKAHEMLSTGEMPPEDEEGPSEHEALVVLQWIKDASAYYPEDGAVDPGWFTIHRLNKVEYRNTMRDLLGIDPDLVDLAEGLPADDTGYGFDNNADVLTVSPMHLERYLVAAERAIDLGLGPMAQIDTEPKPIGGLTLGANGNSLGGGGYMLFSRGSVNASIEAPIAGEYEISVFAWETHGGDENAELSLRIDGRQVKAFRVGARRGEEQECKVRLPLARGSHTIEAWFTNDYYEKDVADRNLAIDAMMIAGPLAIDDGARPAGYGRWLGGPERLAESGAARRILGDFAARAFRRPIERDELERLLAFYRASMGAGETREGAIRLAMTACLVSGSFIYRTVANPSPDDAEAVYRLDDYELASRLSYFLWSSMPDEELLRLAGEGGLGEEATLRAQVRRMLADPKSEAFTENFVGQWLQLRNLERIAFDRDLYPEYDEALRSSMIEEARLFLSDVVRNDRSVLDLIDSSDTFVDQRLARLYDLPEVSGDRFVRVTLPEDSPRGGVLTMAGVLAVTSYPTRTSPVLRGLYVLDQVLGMAPPPPPADIPPLEQAKSRIGENATLREQLDAHLTDATCASCHRRMDPIGFAMENFGPTGAWRDEAYGQPIDASGRLPGGVQFRGVEELKQILLARQGQFVENLVRHVMTYALGRGPEPFDRPVIMKIVRQTRESGDRFGALIEAIAVSESFRSCRGREKNP